MTNRFFKTTPLYKEFIMLDLIEKDQKITQRKLSRAIDTSVSSVNNYIDRFESTNLITRNYSSTKDVTYLLTPKGLERKKFLSVSYLIDTQRLYDEAKKNVIEFLNRIEALGYDNIILYGSGEVAVIFIQTLLRHTEIRLKIVAIIDDDLNKQGETLFGHKIMTPKRALELNYDGILIASYTHAKTMLNKLEKLKFNREKIIHYFE